MANGNSRAKLTQDVRFSHTQCDWHSATRQAERDVIRMAWARSVLAEEDMHPSTHSPARVRRAQNIVASLLHGQS